jgi:hypothetical protein
LGEKGGKIKWDLRGIEKRWVERAFVDYTYKSAYLSEDKKREFLVERCNGGHQARR